MNINTGQYRPVTSPDDMRENEVFVSGSLEQIEELSRRLKLGAAEVERRKARRKIQKGSRKQNR